MSAKTVNASRSQILPISSRASTASRPSRVFAMLTTIASTRRADRTMPAVGRSFIDGRRMSAAASLASDQHAKQESDTGADADRRPRVLMHVAVGIGRDLTSLCDCTPLHIAERRLGLPETRLRLALELRQFFAGLACGGRKDTFHRLDQRAEFLHEVVERRLGLADTFRHFSLLFLPVWFAPGGVSGRTEVLCGEVPIDQVLEPGRDIVGALVLVIEIVGMLPDVDGQQRRLAPYDGGVGIVGRRNLERAVLADDQP